MAVIENLVSTDAQVVRLRNDGDKEFVQKYAGVKYRIPPGSETIVPFMAMCLWLGHPNAVDIDKKRRFRTQEFQRLCVKWGIYEHHERIEEMFPKVSAWDILDPTHEFITVVKDPDGRHLTPDVQTKMERENIEQQMAAMQRQIAEMQAMLSAQNNAAAAGIAAGDTRTDAPTHRPELQVSGPLPDPEADEQVDTSANDAMVDRPTPKPVPRA